MHRSYGLALLPLLLLTGCPTKAKPDLDAGSHSDGSVKNDGAVGDGSASDGSANDGPKGDGAPGTTTLQITSPLSGAHTNGTVSITVATSGGAAPGTISLFLDDGASITTLSAPSPYTYTWDTTQVAEGPHTLVAKSASGSPQIVSSPVTVNVDRTAPKVMSTIPATGATNVVLRAPITVTFSEAMAKSSIGAGSIGLTIGGTAIASTATLSADGTIASISIGDPTSFALPGVFAVNFASTVTDLAGNALVGPTPSWSWNVPDFMSYATIAGTGDALSNPVLVISKTFQPTVAFADLFVSSSGSVQRNTLHVQRSDGQTWTDLGRPSPNGDESYGFSMALDPNDNPVVAWAEKGNQVYVSSWTGTVWGASSTAVDSLAPTGTLASSPVVRLDPSGLPVLGWLQKYTSQFSMPDIFLTRWTGTAWTSTPGELGLVGVTAFDLVLDPQGDPIVAWRETNLAGVDIFRGAVKLVSPMMTATDDPTLGLDKMSDPLLIEGTTAFSVFAFSAGAWQTAVPTTIQVDSTAQSPKLRTDPDNNPIVGWIDSAQFSYARWTGSAWNSRAGIFGDGQGNEFFDISVDSRGTVWLMGCNASRVLVIMSNY
jgi:hypothetical protein